jgi:hypothetical protein
MGAGLLVGDGVATQIVWQNRCAFFWRERTFNSQWAPKFKRKQMGITYLKDNEAEVQLCTLESFAGALLR